MFMGYNSSDFKDYGVPLIIRLVVWGTSHFPALQKCAPPRGYTLEMSVPLYIHVMILVEILTVDDVITHL